MKEPSQPTVGHIFLAGLLAWLVPGLGHIFVGARKRGLIILVTITATFWTGVAIGGAGATVYPQRRKLWFMAQLLTGSHSMVAYALHNRVLRALPATDPPPLLASWKSVDIAVHYTGIAGLLNLLVILDAMARVERSSSKPQAIAAQARGDP